MIGSPNPVWLSPARTSYYGPTGFKHRSAGPAGWLPAAKDQPPRRRVMGSFSIWHYLILGVVALLLFGGRGKVSDLMGDFGKGINSFKKGLAEKDDPKVINAEDTNKDKTTV